MYRHKLDNDEITIEKVSHYGLCSGCGACVGVCFPEAIELEISKAGNLRPKIDYSKCTGCNICHKVCPGWKIDFPAMNKRVFGKIPHNQLVGNFSACFTGYAQEESIRFNSSSGGMITALLTYALKEGFIDGTLVTKMDKNNPLHPEVFIAKTEEEILEARGSKYCPVPVGTGIKDILKRDERYIVVGLPCHLLAFRKAEYFFNKLRRNVVAYFGLFCGHTPSYRATTFFLQNQGVSLNEITKIFYRGDGWPGKMTIGLPRDVEKKYNLTEYWGSLFGMYYFTLNRCMLCPDYFAELSDISFGDAWHKDYKKDTKGTSMFIVRNKHMNDLIIKAINHNVISVESISPEKLLLSYQGNIFFKKINIKSRALIYKIFLRQKVPLIINDNNEKKIGARSFLWSLLVDFIPIINNRLGNLKINNIFLSYPPNLFMKIERKLYLLFIRIQGRIRSL